MRRSAIVLLLGAIVVAGCGGGSSSSGTTSPAGGTPKKATAPNAPAGSEVVTCKVGAAGARELRATALDCATARRTMRAWERSRACALGEGASRGSCDLGRFRCQAVRSGGGAAVSCARSGGDVAFLVEGR
ncbi:MAG: hypothetical protein QM729_18235 [Solirubrobacterales bacterium]